MMGTSKLNTVISQGICKKTAGIAKNRNPQCYEISCYLKLMLFLTLKQSFRSVAALNRQ
jgi:hypothetical protein